MEHSPQKSLVPGLRASLIAKLERLLAQPLIAHIVPLPETPGTGRALDDRWKAQHGRGGATEGATATRDRPWREDPETGTCSVRVAIGYDAEWRGSEREVYQTVESSVEAAVTFLTDEQRALLVRSPRAFLDLSPGPDTAELVGFETEEVGGSRRVVELKLAAAPKSAANITHLAIVPNLVQLERQLAALQQIEVATDDGPLGPLRALVGLADPAALSREAAVPGLEENEPGERLDEHQRECVGKAMATPHFAVIEGPPGSGKTTVIAGIIRRALARGERALVVSPTHVAVDNVVERLVRAKEGQTDLLEAASLPVRYAARQARLSEKARPYWVGAKSQQRAGAIAERVRARLTEKIPFAGALFRMEDSNARGQAPISAALSRVDSVLCGTPIGLLSMEGVKSAEPGSFGLLIVDEVSKMTLSEFLAIAVKARRWVLVGDPAQLPPFSDGEENGATLDDLVPPMVELACSVGTLLESTRPQDLARKAVVVVSSQPESAALAIRAHLRSVMRPNIPNVSLLGAGCASGIIVCAPEDVSRACEVAASSKAGPFGPARAQGLEILVERGAAPPAVNDERLVGAAGRAHAAIFENAFSVYHAQPWGARSGVRLQSLGSRHGLDKSMPSPELIEALEGSLATESSERCAALRRAIASRFALNAVSVYDWLTGIQVSHFDKSPLVELGTLSSPALQDAVKPFVGTLKKQYRMHASLSRVPRELFYFGDALHDGQVDRRGDCRVTLLRVTTQENRGESNLAEVDAILRQLQALDMERAPESRGVPVMVITPYREQEARLRERLIPPRGGSAFARLDLEVCTLDRCQGREADYVLISLVRSRSTRFFDMPKRWNVALTRARQRLFIVGDVESYLAEALQARRELGADGTGRDARVRPGETRPRMSLLARVLEAYDWQIREANEAGRVDRRAAGTG